MADLIVAMLVLMIIAAAVAYIIRAKKKGARCIGCPAAGKCSGKSGAASECCCGKEL